MTSRRLYLTSGTASSPYPTSSRLLSLTNGLSVTSCHPGEFDSGLPGNTDAGQWRPAVAFATGTAARELDSTGASPSVNRQGWLYDTELSGQTLTASSWGLRLNLIARQGGGQTGRLLMRVTVVSGTGGTYVTNDNLLTTRITGETSHTTGQEGWRDTESRITVTTTLQSFTSSIADTTTSKKHVFQPNERILVELGFGDGNSTTDRTWELQYNTVSSYIDTPPILFIKEANETVGIVENTSTYLFDTISDIFKHTDEQETIQESLVFLLTRFITQPDEYTRISENIVTKLAAAAQDYKKFANDNVAISEALVFVLSRFTTSEQEILRIAESVISKVTAAGAVDYVRTTDEREQITEYLVVILTKALQNPEIQKILESVTTKVTAAGATAYKRSTNEIETVRENIAVVLVITRLAREVEVLLETITRALRAARSRQETEVILENTIRLLSGVRKISDLETITENVKRTIGATRRANDTEAIIESFSKAIGLVKRTAEIEKILEAASRKVYFNRLPSETELILETISRKFNWIRIFSETEKIIENVHYVKTLANFLKRVTSEIEQVRESVNFAKVGNRFANETEAITEYLTVLVTRQLSTPDFLKILENVTTKLQVQYTRRASETEKIVENAFAKLFLNRSTSELEKVLEAVKVSLRAVVPFLYANETVKITENIVVFLNEQNKKTRVRETEAILESVARTLYKRIHINETEKILESVRVLTALLRKGVTQEIEVITENVRVITALFEPPQDPTRPDVSANILFGISADEALITAEDPFRQALVDINYKNYIYNALTRNPLSYQTNIIKSLMEGFSDMFNKSLYILDAENKSLKVHSYNSLVDRQLTNKVNQRGFILPSIYVEHEKTSVSISRRKYESLVIKDKVWNEEEQRAKRTIRLAPVAVDVVFNLNIWSKYANDLDQILEQIYLLFNPATEITIDGATGFKARIIGEDEESYAANFGEDRVLQKKVIINVEGYIPYPEMLITNTGKIEQFNTEIKIIP